MLMFTLKYMTEKGSNKNAANVRKSKAYIKNGK